MSEPFLGMIIIVPYNFAPRGWAFCQGQILPIAQNTALFSLLGTTYGGNGQTTFALPDLRSRVPLNSGQGPGLSLYDLGEQTGTESVTLTVNTLPGHTHTFAPSCSSQAASSSKPSGLVPSAGGSYNNAPDGTMGAGTTGATGGTQPVPIIQPILALNFCIALEGIFPSRN
jgi:microcystin-dependent protein